MLLVATSLRAQQSTHTWCNRILLVTWGDPCKGSITPSHKHSQGGHEARARLYEEPSPYGCRAELVFLLFPHFSCPNCIRSTKKTGGPKCSVAKSSIELSRRSAANLSTSLKYHFKQEAQQEANKNEPALETECAHLRKRQLERNRERTESEAVPRFHSLLVFYDPANGSSESQRRSFCCLLTSVSWCAQRWLAERKEPQHGLKRLQVWRKKRSCLLECFHLKAAVKGSHLQEA